MYSVSVDFRQGYLYYILKVHWKSANLYTEDNSWLSFTTTLYVTNKISRFQHWLCFSTLASYFYIIFSTFRPDWTLLPCSEFQYAWHCWVQISAKTKCRTVSHSVSKGDTKFVDPGVAPNFSGHRLCPMLHPFMEIGLISRFFFAHSCLLTGK